MKTILPKLTAFMLMGLIVGGTLSGAEYDVLVVPAMVLYTMATYKVVMSLAHTLYIRPIKHSYVLTGLFLTVYALFMFQCITILMTGTTQYPELWWNVHGGIAMYVYLRSHVATRRQE